MIQNLWRRLRQPRCRYLVIHSYPDATPYTFIMQYRTFEHARMGLDGWEQVELHLFTDRVKHMWRLNVDGKSYTILEMA